MIVEIRTYELKEGMLQRFLDFFERDAVPLQRAHGMNVVGPFVDMERPDTFIWLRAFPSMVERERMKSALYDGEIWLTKLEAIAMPMIRSISVVLATAPAGFSSDLPAGRVSTQGIP